MTPFPPYRQSIPAPGERRTVWPETGEEITVDEYNQRQAARGSVLQDWIADDVDPDSLTDTTHGQVPQWLRYERAVGALPSPAVDLPPRAPGSKYEAFLRGQQPAPARVPVRPKYGPRTQGDQRAANMTARYKELMAQGVPEAQAIATAKQEFIAADQAVLQDEAQRRADNRTNIALYGRPMNGAELDNLAGAAAPIQVEEELPGRLTRPGAPVTAKDAEIQQANAEWRAGLEPGSDLQARFAPESYDGWMEENVRQPIGAQAQAWVAEHGDARTRESRAKMTPEQHEARDQLRSSETNMSLRPEYLEREIVRWTESTGLPASKVAEILLGDTPPNPQTILDRRRILSRHTTDRRNADLADRKRLVVKRGMAQSNPLEYMQRDDVDDWGRYMAGSALLGRPMRTEPLDVQKQAEAARVMQEQRMAMGAAGRGDLSPGQERAAQAAAEAKEREANPTAAGRKDIASKDYTSKPAIDILKADAEAFDTTNGGFSEDDERNLRQHWIKNYGMEPQTAYLLAKKFADSRRYTGWGGQPAPDIQGLPPGGPFPPAPTPNPGAAPTTRSGSAGARW